MTLGSGSGARAVDPADLERRVDLLAAMAPAARADFARAVTRRVVPDGGRIYTQEDRHRVMYRVVRGRVGLSYARVDGKELTFAYLGPGECLGISTLIDGQGLPHSASARGEVELEVLDQAALQRLRTQHPSVDDALLQTLCRDVRLLSSQLSEAALDHLPARVARRLLALGGGSDGWRVELPQSELALLFGVSRQTLNKVLRRFEEDGLVRLGYGGLRVVRPDGLRELARLE